MLVKQRRRTVIEVNGRVKILSCAAKSCPPEKPTSMTPAAAAARVSSTYETLDEAALKSEAWLIKGYSADAEKAYCWTITLTGQGSPIYRE